MQNKQNILITIDVNNGYNDAYFACLEKRLTQYQDSELFLLYVLSQVDFLAVEFPHALSRFLSQQNERERQAKKKLDRFASLLAIPDEHRILVQGDPKRVILGEAHILKSDLIILGNHSPNVVELAGHITQSVTKEAPCDVLALHIPAGLIGAATLSEKGHANAA